MRADFIFRNFYKFIDFFNYLLYYIFMENLIKNYFNKQGIQINQEQIEKFVIYFNELIEWNNKFNLTSITEPKDVVIKHFLDSVLPVENFKKYTTLLDIGSGAGFPAIPLKILLPNLNMVLVDSLNKRVEFLKHVKNVLKFDNFECIHSRAEDIAKQSNLREKFDVCVARAVAGMNTLSELTLPMVRIGGDVVAYKGDNANNELANATNAISKCGGKYYTTYNYKLPEDYGIRNIIVIRKIKQTPKNFPRGGNKPKLQPL